MKSNTLLILTVAKYRRKKSPAVRKVLTETLRGLDHRDRRIMYWRVLAEHIKAIGLLNKGYEQKIAPTEF
jgi:hypothetical protein